MVLEASIWRVAKLSSTGRTAAMTSRKKPVTGFWIAVALVAVLVGYPLSFGPACWIFSRIRFCSSTVLNVYRPLDWLACESVWTPEPTEHRAQVLGGLLVQPGVHGNLVADAHLAALAMEHGLTLCSTDGDFARFPKLRWQNPLA